MKIYKSKRDHNGDLMTYKDMKLEKRGLYQSSKFKTPIIMSTSLEVKKDPLVNLVKQHYKAMKKKAHKVDNTMESIMLQVVRDEAERNNIDMTKIDSIEAITKLIDVELIRKIEAYISINKKLSEPESVADI
jgi:hypothetical protein